MLTIVIADDELAARRRLKRLLASETDVSVIGEFSDGTAAIDGIRQLRPDVALLDIQMPERDGLEVAREVGGPNAPAIVFVTAFDKYALRAFEVHAMDYLVKPVDPVRLHDTLVRLQSRPTDRRPGDDELARLTRVIEEMRHATTAALSDDRKRPRDRLLVGVDGRSILVTATDIDWIEAAGNYVRLHRGASSMMMRESLASVEASLDRHLFARVHRGAIVNIARIKEVQPWFSGAAIVILTTGQRLTVSRSYRKQFEARFGIQSDD
jgi:two-component system LytT family response regulator